MNAKIKLLFRNAPPYSWSVLLLIVIFWLTLSPAPLPPMKLPEFLSWDKLAHGAMFGALYVVIMFDRIRSGNSFSFSGAIAIGILCSAFGGIIELLQGTSIINRSCELGDWVADTIGVIFFAFISFIFFRIGSKQ